MKDKVTVDGVVLTRAQIEAAVKELNAAPAHRDLIRGVEGFCAKGSGGEAHYYFPLDHEEIRMVAANLEPGRAAGLVIDADGHLYLCRYLIDAPVTTAIRSTYSIVRILGLDVTEVTE